MRSIFIKNKETVKSLNLKFTLMHIILIVFSLYKNGIKLYLEGNISFIYIFKPILIIFIPLIIASIFYYIKNRSFNILKSNLITYSIVIAAVTSANVNLILYSLVVIVSFLFYLYKPLKKINYPSLIMIVLISLSNFFGSYNLANKYEMSTNFNFTLKNYLIGQQPNGLLTSFTLLIIIIFIILLMSKYYKKYIAASSITAYLLVISLISLLTSFSNFCNYLFSFNVLYGFIFIATLNSSSPYKVKDQIIFGSLSGILTAILINFIPNLAIFTSILLISLIYSNIGFLKTKKT